MKLIINADDFGYTPGVNHGIVTAHRAGVITSTSLMVRGAAAREAVKLARENPNLGVGLHLDLAEWIYRDEEWQLLYSVVSTEDEQAVLEELARQLDAFRELMGCNPTHLDSHQHVHRTEPVRSILRQAARELGVPLRHFTPGVRYCGDFYGQTYKGDPHPPAISVEAALRILANLQDGTTEMACHPASSADMDSIYKAERVLEFQTLTDPRVSEALKQAEVMLCTFREVPLMGRVQRPGEK